MKESRRERDQENNPLICLQAQTHNYFVDYMASKKKTKKKQPFDLIPH